SQTRCGTPMASSWWKPTGCRHRRRDWTPFRRSGEVAARQQYDFRLTRYGESGWEATFYPAGIGHSLTPMVGSGWAREPWAAVQAAAGEALRRGEAAGVCRS